MKKNDLKDPATWIPRDLFAVFCGEGSDKLLTYYDKCVAKKNPMAISANWLAILLLPAWLGYRRLWSQWLTLTLLFGILPFIEHFIKFEFPPAGYGGIGIALGMMANSMLLTKGTAIYQKLKKEGKSDAAITEEIRDQAAKSIPLAIAALFLSFAATIGLALMAAAVFGVPL